MTKTIGYFSEPEMGMVIPGTAGFRKLRWQDKRRGKGKRWGLRVNYYVLDVDAQVWLFTVFDKDEAIDLSADEKRILKRAMQSELISRQKSR